MAGIEFLAPSCLAGVHGVGPDRVDLFTHPTAGLVANDCPVCWPADGDT